MADPKAYRLEISWTWSEICCDLHETGTNLDWYDNIISCLGPATKTKSDQSEFVVRPVSCKCIKRNVWRPIQAHAGLNSSRPHVNTPLVEHLTTVWEVERSNLQPNQH